MKSPEHSAWHITNGSVYWDKHKHLQERQEGMVRKKASFAVAARVLILTLQIPRS